MPAVAHGADETGEAVRLVSLETETDETAGETETGFETETSFGTDGSLTPPSARQRCTFPPIRA